jgi:hypothetical protein
VLHSKDKNEAERHKDDYRDMLVGLSSGSEYGTNGDDKRRNNDEKDDDDH